MSEDLMGSRTIKNPGRLKNEKKLMVKWNFKCSKGLHLNSVSKVCFKVFQALLKLLQLLKITRHCREDEIQGFQFSYNTTRWLLGQNIWTWSTSGYDTVMFYLWKKTLWQQGLIHKRRLQYALTASHLMFYWNEYEMKRTNLEQDTCCGQVIFPPFIIHWTTLENWLNPEFAERCILVSTDSEKFQNSLVLILCLVLQDTHRTRYDSHSNFLCALKHVKAYNYRPKLFQPVQWPGKIRRFLKSCDHL